MYFAAKVSLALFFRTFPISFTGPSLCHLKILVLNYLYLCNTAISLLVIPPINKGLGFLSTFDGLRLGTYRLSPKPAPIS